MSARERTLSTTAGPRVFVTEELTFESYEAARAAAVERGGALFRERMTGSYYSAPGGVWMHVQTIGWAPGARLSITRPKA